MPLSRAFLDSEKFIHHILHTGQHYDENMSGVFFEELGIPSPKWNLGISGGSHGQMTGLMLHKIEVLLLDNRPDMLVVLGDTNSTLAGALAASKINIPVAHVEAGLRSGRRNQPEEINRKLTDHISDLLFCPTKNAVEQLVSEGVSTNVHHAGDVMYDSILMFKELSESQSKVCLDNNIDEENFVLMTLHREENTLDVQRFNKVIDYIRESGVGKQIVFPVHPRTKKFIVDNKLDVSDINIIEPVGYVDMIKLLSSAKGLYTDSGGMQKEAYFLKTPCVTMRDETEWMETIEAGWNRLWINDEYDGDRKVINDYGTGKAANKIVGLIDSYL